MLDFVLYTKADYRPNWHHELICKYLDQFASGDIKRLMIFAPPRHGKSQLVSRHLPAFLFGVNPDLKVVGASYNTDLAQAMNRDAQRIIDSPEYERLFPETRLWGKNVRAMADGSYLRNADVFEIVNRQGSYRGAGVLSGLSGYGFDRGIIDDPFKDRLEANSPTVRLNKWDWYTSVFYTRQAQTAGILITHTRWHTHDIAGQLLELEATSSAADRWEILNLPAIATGRLHPEDPRSPGEALWPERFPLSFLESVKANNAFEFEALYQQSPLSQSGGLFNTDKLAIVDAPPENMTRTVRFYDLAVTAKSSADFTVGLKLGVTPEQDYIVCDVWRAQRELPDVQEAIVQNAGIDGAGTLIRLEAEKAGIVQLQYLLRDARMGPYSMDAVPPVGDKYTRAGPVATRVNNGKVKLVRGQWNRAFIDELALFGANAEHDDQVDALSGAYALLADSGPLILFEA
jgi:predicted phage terminase large subunit-like protein